MKNIKNNYIKKIGLITFALIIFALGIFNIKAESTVMTAEDFLTKLNDDAVSVVKLGTNIEVTQSLHHIKSSSDNNYVKTIDLNGFDLISSGKAIELSTGYYIKNLNIINSSSNESTIKADWGLSIYEERPNVNEEKTFNILINNVDIEYLSSGNNNPLININTTSYSPSLTNLNIDITNSNLKGASYLFKFSNGFKKINFNLSEIKYTGIGENSKFYDGNNTIITYDQIIGVDQAYFLDDTQLIVDGTLKVEAEGTVHEIKSKIEGIVISPIRIDLTYGYTQDDINTAKQTIYIKNNYSTDITIEKSQLVVNENFIIEGPENVTIAPDQINSSFSIKGVGLGHNVGGFITTIDLKDSGDTIATADLKWYIERATYDFNLSLDNWSIWGEPKEPVITGVPAEVLNETDPVFTYTGISGTSYGPSNQAPTTTGDYNLKVRFHATNNYLSKEKNVDFKITNSGKEIITAIAKPSANIINYKQTYDLEDFLGFDIQLQKDGTNISLDYSVIGVEQPSPNYVSNNSFITVTIKLSDTDYLNYEFNGGTQTYTASYPIIIHGNIPEFSYNPLNINSSTNTPLSLTKGNNSNLDLTGKVTVDNNKQTVNYSLADDYAGKVTILGNNLQVNSDFEGNLIIITAEVFDINLGGDDYNEYTAKSTAIYVKMTEKTVLTISGLDNNQTFNYDGSQKTPNGTLSVEGNYVDLSELVVNYVGVSSTTYNSNVPPVNAGFYQVTYSIPATNLNYSGSVTYNFEILKASPSYIIPTGLTARVGDTLDNVILPTNFTWEVPSTIITTSGDFQANAIYNSGNPNYLIANVLITITAYNYYNVNTTVNGIGGAATSATDILEGSSYTVIFTPDLGYKVNTVTVNGTAQTITNNELVLIVDENKEVVVTYEKIKYNINVNVPVGIILDKPGITNVEYGGSFTLNLKVELGYKLIAVKVNGIDFTSILVGDILSLTNILEDKEISFELEKIEYKVIEGANQEIEIKDNNEAKFKINADFNLLEKVYINGVLLDPSNYIVTEGSTIITLKETYLATLNNGVYIMTVLFSDGGDAKTNFTINRAKTETTIPNTEKPVEEINPKTSDSIIIYLILMVSSLLTFSATTYIIKKQSEEV